MICSLLLLSGRLQKLKCFILKKRELIYMNEKRKKVSAAVVGRLPRYLRYVREYLDNKIIRVSSNGFADRMNITASQVRQDFNNFRGFGQQGYGYRLDKLYDGLIDILGLNRTYNLIVIGGGNLGQALTNYREFEDYGLYIRAVFDINPRLIGMTIRGIEIHDIDLLSDYIKKNSVDIAILTLPSYQAAAIADELVRNGIKGVWNFSPIDLELPSDVPVESVYLTDSIMTLIYRINEIEHANNGCKVI